MKGTAGSSEVTDRVDSATQTEWIKEGQEDTAEVLRVPTWQEFQHNEAICELLSFMVRKKTFTLNYVKRAMRDYLERAGGDRALLLGMKKPDGMSVTEMFREDMFESGVDELGDDGFDLKADAMCSQHVKACGECKAAGVVQASCYFSKMVRCISHGWQPRIRATEVSPVYEVEGNYRTVDLYPQATTKEFNKMVLHHVVKEVSMDEPGVVSPMGAVIKSSDKRRAHILTGVRITDQQSLSRASTALVNLGYPELKARLTNDITASGVNRASLCPPFRDPSLAEGIMLITPNCWIGKGDVSRYFYCFPFALVSRFFFFVIFLGRKWSFLRCMFGFGPCPYYCSTWSAEYRTWVLAAGVPCAHMVDDWLTVGDTQVEAKVRLDLISNILESVGHEMQAEKMDLGQTMLFLGILINTIRIPISFDAVQARGMRMQLEMHISRLRAGFDLDKGTVRSVAGSLNWYSEVLQSGRVHIRSWWSYVHHGTGLGQAMRLRLERDTEWWIAVLTKWGDSAITGLEYPILSHDIMSRPGMIVVVQSDMSGPDGFGYFYGYLGDGNPMYLSRAWGGDYQFRSSHDGEMQALLHYVLRTDEEGKIVVWLTDSLSGVWSINKGSCHSDVSMVTLEAILECCDIKRIQLIALWLPREHNQFADYLSHLSSFLGREEVEGRVCELNVSQESRVEGRREEELKGEEGDEC